MLPMNLANRRIVSEVAMHVTNKAAFVLRMRLFRITLMLKQLPTVPNMSIIKRPISPKSHGLYVTICVECVADDKLLMNKFKFDIFVFD
jgi:hypothetical protein